MKKIVSLVLALIFILSLTACGKVEITTQELYEASNLDALLEKHESVHVRYTADGVVYDEKYLSKDYTYSFMDGETYGLPFDLIFFSTNHSCYGYYDGEYSRDILLAPDGMGDTYRLENEGGYAFEEGTLQENIQSVKQKDGRIIVTTSWRGDAPESTGMEGMVSYSNEYVLDAKTREMISVTDVISYDVGAVYHVTLEFFYDGEGPEGMKVFQDFEQQTEDLRTITIVSNPGAENEWTETVQVAKGLIATLTPDLDVLTTCTMYTDAACTEIFDPYEDTESDVTVYVEWDE